MISIYLYHREKSVKTLGPGERYVIWTQGCGHKCKGCIVPESHSLNEGGEYVSIELILREIDENKNLRGITISGGEPFLQRAPLLELLREINKRKLDVICYSGFLYEELKKSKETREILKYIDILIDGKYEEDKNTGSYLRGSDNQRIIHLKSTYKRYEKEMKEAKNRNIEIKILEDNNIFLAGIPPLNLNENWSEIRKKIYE